MLFVVRSFDLLYPLLHPIRLYLGYHGYRLDEPAVAKLLSLAASRSTLRPGGGAIGRQRPSPPQPAVVMAPGPRISGPCAENAGKPQGLVLMTFNCAAASEVL
jgi:hypothetical protein